MEDYKLKILKRRSEEKGYTLLNIAVASYSRHKDVPMLFQFIEEVERSNKDLTDKLVNMAMHAKNPQMPDFLVPNLVATRVGQMSDGYHTFDELYHHRLVLFVTLTKAYKDYAWKSRKHDDGTMFEDYFIVGITTPEGDFTYHYHERNWDMFDVRECDLAPHFDGHTSKDIERLLSL